ncbi:alpha-amylase family glycosyl hydrolase [Segatella copri]|uniref:Alpha-amylase family glycosyl hydrolase n=1 Tax=Segatella copri TaxID=165179 RepID=A0AAW5I403_9BACT|nr:alpha-amylase family glycosyl hydrolase [Segatella copri]MCP9545088.1 alpha-amylase family glycosyl hydrolase [Segatella copri]MCP9547944.1 alpha-amylase family glycosyl hydrolase [Segatella copri]MCP9554454.1 alpha-amylase family glycosyl hydrolase [Segatella copri]MCP9569097.1 alpha-amylase family glycosyl hydrolase [Segatella copri]
MKKLAAKLWAVLMLMLVSLQTMATDVFTSNRTDFRDESIYFMMTTRFYDGDPSNNVLCWDNQEAQKSTKDPCWRGDFQGVIDKLDYIKALGFTAIWITPVVQNASGYDYHGYHASDFSKVDCRYQSGDGKKSGDVMFQELIDKAHKKGIKIILDIVLNHTGNFGEEHFCKEFDRDTRLRNQADINACMIPNLETLGSDYPGLQPGYQYQRRLAMMKNTDGQNHDPHNYWHHFGNFNWDLPNRWWAQIAGDCVDLNTENNTVADYLVKCYGNFIKMGVDGFRIDTSGHISRLTFCKQFIPQFAALGKQYEDKRLNKAPFFMYGEVCARFGSVQYRGQDNLSPYYYTWKAPKDLMDGFDGSQSYWDTQEIYDSGTGYDAKLMPLCEKDNADSPESNNTFMLNGAWHEPDYSQSSGFNVIDFPLHYNFSNAGSAYGLAKSGDMKYNDATYNVVYVDSHDYGPQPSDGIRFSGSDAQWAENLSLMFTFRGIPCLYYGSEVGFRRGSVIDKGPNGPLSNTGRAYFGGYITGDVEASDFGEYKASGNVAASLNHDLAQHLIRLNKIRQAVPALRKGQWTDEGCAANGGIAFKRAYKDSYALVALNGGATFTDCPAGTYTDLVTGKTYTGSTITVDAPSNKGQVRVLVKDWKGGKLIDDGAFIYETAAQHKGGQDYDGNEEAGTTWVDETPLQPVSVSLSPAGGSFRTNTVTVTATLSEDALSGWYQIEGQDKVDLTPGEAATFTIGEGMNFNQTKTVTWSATSSEGEKTGKVTYTKVDPNASITVYVKADKAPTIYAWVPSTPAKELTGAWHGKTMDGPEEIGGVNYWYKTFDGVESFNVILNNGSGAQSGEISGITGDIYLEYDGGTSAKKIDAPVNTVAAAKVTLSPNGGDFEKTVTVTATLSNNAQSGWYKIGNGEQVALTPGKAATFTLGADMMEGESKTVTWSATSADNETKTGSATFNKMKEVVIPTPTGIFAYFLAPSDWSNIHAYAWSDGPVEYAGGWPGVACTKIGVKKNGLDVWMWKYDGDLTTAPTNIIFNNGGGQQTNDFVFENGAVYNRDGKTNESVSTGINQVGSKKAPAKLKIYSINGVKVAEVNKVSDAEYVLAPGMYICNGKKFVIK